MGSSQLTSLESLSHQRALQSQQRVRDQQAEVDQLDRQQQELRAINREYQRTSEGDELVAPALLAHRRTFVTRLTERIELLDVERAQQQQRLQQQISQQQQHIAQNAAISSVLQTREAQERLEADRREQRLNDETSRMALARAQEQSQGEDHE